jgi:rhodanese-related sulfurtransferase
MAACAQAWSVCLPAVLPETAARGVTIIDPEVMPVSFIAFLQKSPINMLLFGIAVGSGFMLVWPLLARLWGGGIDHIGATQAVQLINRRDALVLDIRDAESFAAGHIPNSRNIPAKDLSGRMKEIERYRSRPVIVSGDGGQRAASVCGALKKQGFSEVFAIRGVREWTEASLPLEKKAS